MKILQEVCPPGVAAFVEAEQRKESDLESTLVRLAPRALPVSNPLEALQKEIRALVVEEQQWKDIQESHLFDDMPLECDDREKAPTSLMNESDHLKIAEDKERLLIQVSYPQALLERFRRVILPAVSPWSFGNGSPWPRRRRRQRSVFSEISK